MPDEEKVSQSEQPVAEKSATTADLDSAYRELLEETEAPQGKKDAKPEKEAKPLTPEEEEKKREHDERSQLGRKVKKMEDDLQAFMAEMRSNFRPPPQEPKGDEIPEYIGTAEDARKIYRAERQRELKEEREQRVRYENSYITTLRSMKVDDPEQLKEEITSELFNVESPFNKIVTGDPVADARINYAEAKAAIVLRKIANRPKPNVRGGKGSVPTNLNVGQDMGSRSSGLSEDLDEFSREFVKKTGMSEESLADALKGDVPLHLAGSKR